MAEPQLADNPPDAIHAERPGTSGPHLPQVAVSGAYEKPIDERLLIHNVEHGYVVFWYDEEADPQQVEELQSWAQERVDEGLEKVIVAEYFGPLPEDADFAAVAWDHRQLCEEFDADVAQVFLDELHDRPDVPEAVFPHTPIPVNPGSSTRRRPRSRCCTRRWAGAGSGSRRRWTTRPGRSPPGTPPTGGDGRGATPGRPTGPPARRDRTVHRRCPDRMTGRLGGCVTRDAATGASGA